MMKFKITKVKGIEYLQIWENGSMLIHAGSAKKVHKLVKARKDEMKLDD